jgi:hypothetical protein
MSIFNLVVERKKKTGPITPKYEGIYPPVPSCEPPKKELPDPPFNATAARSYAHWKEEEAINTIRDKIWREITDEVKKGGVTAVVTLPLHPRPSTFGYTEVERACQLLSKNLLSIVKVMAEDFVKNGYQMTIVNDIYSDKYYDAVKKEVGFYTDNSFYLDKIQIEISWEEPENVREPYLKIVDHSGVLIREMDKDNSEHYVRPERVFIKTKGELENGDKSDE